METGAITGKPLYNFLEVDASELLGDERIIDRFKNRQVEGVIVHNVITESEAESIVGNLAKVKDELLTKEEICAAFPIGFAAAAQKTENDEYSLSNYFQESEKFVGSFEEAFGTNLIQRLERVFNLISSDKKYSVPAGFENEGSFLPGQFRRIYPNVPGFPAHCGNAFDALYSEFYVFLNKIVQTNNQLSYFIPLQYSESGGELTLYDKEWKEGQSMHSFHEFLDENGNAVDTQAELLNQKVMQIKPPVGSLLSFVGGEIWHKVEPSVGTKDRITFGGFYGESKESNTFSFFA